MSYREVAGRMKRLPLYGKLLVILAALFLILSIGYYAVMRFQASSIYRTTTYQWTTGSLALQNDSTTVNTYCAVAPVNGEQRSVLVPTQVPRRFISTRLAVEQPWFTGAATVSCNGTVSAWQGGSAGQWFLISSVLYKILSAVVILIPLVAFIVISAARRARGTRP